MADVGFDMSRASENTTSEIAKIQELDESEKRAAIKKAQEEYDEAAQYLLEEVKSHGTKTVTALLDGVKTWAHELGKNLRDYFYKSLITEFLSLVWKVFSTIFSWPARQLVGFLKTIIEFVKNAMMGLLTGAIRAGQAVAGAWRSAWSTLSNLKTRIFSNGDDDDDDDDDNDDDDNDDDDKNPSGFRRLLHSLYNTIRTVVLAVKDWIVPIFKSDNLVVVIGLYKLFKHVLTNNCISAKKWLDEKMGSISPFNIVNINLENMSAEDKIRTATFLDTAIGNATSFFKVIAIRSFARVVGKPITLLLDSAGTWPLVNGAVSLLRTVLLDVEEIFGKTTELVIGNMYLFTNVIIFEEKFGLNAILECLNAQPVTWTIHNEITGQLIIAEDIPQYKLHHIWQCIDGDDINIRQRIARSANIIAYLASRGYSNIFPTVKIMAQIITDIANLTQYKVEAMFEASKRFAWAVFEQIVSIAQSALKTVKSLMMNLENVSQGVASIARWITLKIVGIFKYLCQQIARQIISLLSGLPGASWLGITGETDEDDDQELSLRVIVPDTSIEDAHYLVFTVTKGWITSSTAWWRVSLNDKQRTPKIVDEDDEPINEDDTDGSTQVMTIKVPENPYSDPPSQWSADMFVVVENLIFPKID